MPSPFSPSGRPIACDGSLREGNGGGNNQFSLARGKVIALPTAGTAQHKEPLCDVQNTTKNLKKAVWVDGFF